MSFNIDLSRPYIMGVLNVTPDSFSDGGEFIDIQFALNHVENMIENGADIIDIGGESSRPNSDDVPMEVEWDRIGKLIKEIKNNFNIPISVDTYKSEIAKRSLDIGVDIINDISGFSSSKMRSVVSKYEAMAIIMHMKGTPKNMQNNPQYENVVDEIYTFLSERVDLCNKAGITNCIVDPGIGFGKTYKNNIDILKNIEKFTNISPVLIGTSRKSFLGQITGIQDPKKRDIATHTTTILALQKGVRLFRVHDVKGTKNAIDVYNSLK